MSYKIITIPNFDKEVKSLSKKHRSIKVELAQLGKQLLENPRKGDEIFQNCYKIRMAIAPKGKVKSGGARVITYIYIQEETVYLLSIYDKSEHTSISDAVIRDLIKCLDFD